MAANSDSGGSMSNGSDGSSSTTINTNIGIRWPCYGEYFCIHCQRRWISCKAWKFYGQECAKCRGTVQATTLLPLHHYYCNQCHRSWKFKWVTNGDKCKQCKLIAKPFKTHSEFKYYLKTLATLSNPNGQQNYSHGYNTVHSSTNSFSSEFPSNQAAKTLTMATNEPIHPYPSTLSYNEAVFTQQHAQIITPDDLDSTDSTTFQSSPTDDASDFSLSNIPTSIIDQDNFDDGFQQQKQIDQEIQDIPNNDFQQDTISDIPEAILVNSEVQPEDKPMTELEITQESVAAEQSTDSTKINSESVYLNGSLSSEIPSNEIEMNNSSSKKADHRNEQISSSKRIKLLIPVAIAAILIGLVSWKKLNTLKS